MMEKGIPKLVNFGNENEYSIAVNDTLLTNIMGFELDINIDNNSLLSLEIINPEVDLIIGGYSIKSKKVDNIKTLYVIKDNKTGEVIECQHVKFDGTTLYIGKTV